MNIAVLGGRFDPPHFGHFWVARQTLERAPDIDEVWLMPTNNHPWKKAFAEPYQRLEMTKLIENDKIKASSIEIDKGGVSYTIETIDYLKKNYPEHKFSWIVGSDAIADFFKWRNAQKLARMIPFLVFPRGGFPIKILPPGMKKIDGQQIIETNLSSSHVRERIQNHLSVYGLIPEEVKDYIKNKNLYQNS